MTSMAASSELPAPKNRARQATCGCAFAPMHELNIQAKKQSLQGDYINRPLLQAKGSASKTVAMYAVDLY